MEISDHEYCYSIGASVLVLTREYDPDQLWFDFIHAVFPSRNSVWKITKKDTRQPLHYRAPERGVGQLALRYSTAKRVSKGHRKKQAAAGWPTFQRNNEDKLLTLRTRFRAKKAEINEWCDANLVGLYVPNKHYVFELEEDYMLALLSSRYFIEVSNPHSEIAKLR